MNQPRVLIVDDDAALLQALPQAIQLRMGGVIIETADSAAAALELIGSRTYAAIVTDIKMPGMDGLALLTEIRARCSDTPALMITGHGENALAIEALRRGAHDFIQKPIDRDYFIAALRRAIEMAELNRRVKEQLPLRWLMRPCLQLEKVVQQIKQVAGSSLTILIQGETGTGKELVARAIHQLSGRHEEPFVAVDCGAIPDTLIESELLGYEKGAFTGAHQRKKGQFALAEGGSLFLDEIANLPVGIQAKLLRVLQERWVQPLGSEQPVRVDVRVIAASNIPLDREVREGRFRQDVYYRLNEFVINLPPLRERDDILLLANDFLAEASMEFGRPCRGISESAVQALLRYRWPGNVRELRNAIRRAIVLASEVIDSEQLSFLYADSCSSIASRKQNEAPCTSLKEVAEAAASFAEQEAIRCTLKATKGNKSEAARLLRTDYKTLHLKMKQYSINAAHFKDF